MNNLLPPNATPLERRIAQTNAVISDIDFDISKLMDPDRIPLAFLPWLAWHLGVETWRDHWPEHIKRARVKTALRIARIKGTAEAVRQVCASFGAHVVMREWFALTPRGRPGTFEVLLTTSTTDRMQTTAEQVADIRAEIDKAKRASAHYTFKQGVQAMGTLRIGGGARAAVYRRLSLMDR